MADVRKLLVLSIYEGFFTGGARALHSSVVTGLHAMGAQEHSVLSIHSEMHRETIVQRMDDDPRYHRLSQAGVRITSLDRRPGHATDPRTFTEAELAVAASQAIRADVILSLKEQPLHLVNQVGFPNRPVIVCLHRSDPENQGQAMAELKTAIADGRVAACICCAESTKTSYQAAGIPAELLHVIPNGVDVSRFRPVTASKRARLRRSLGVPTDSTVIVFAARYDPMKNTSLFLRAAKEFLKRRGRGRVLMCGAGMSTTNALLDDDVRAAFGDAPHLLKRLRLLGIRNDMESVYAAADVVSLTSSVGEAAPLCLIEGMMCGAIPVATDIGDCAAIVAGHGLITPPDAMAIAAAWIEAVERRAEFAPALIRSRVRFSQTRMIDSYSALIHQIYRQVGHAAR